jgi:hypothetical protein
MGEQLHNVQFHLLPSIGILLQGLKELNEPPKLEIFRFLNVLFFLTILRELLCIYETKELFQAKDKTLR